MPQTIEDIFRDAQWYFDDIDADKNRLVFVRAARQSLSQATFLDHRWTSRGERIEIPIADAVLAGRQQTVATAPRFIWHTAFCCSTLLARSIDVAGANLSIKEPDAIEKLANLKRTKHPLAQDARSWRGLIDTSLQLYGRAFEQGEKITIKPSNSANNLISEVLAPAGNGKALLLYSGLRSFLVSIIKKREHGRHFARRLFSAFAMDDNFARRIAVPDLMKLTDLQIAAMVWLIQIAIFRDILARFPVERVSTLDADTLLADPGRALLRLDEFFEIGLGSARVEEIVAGPVFKRNSKNEGESFDASQRASEAYDVEEAFGPDLDLIVGWAAKEWRDLSPLSPLPRNIAA